MLAILPDALSKDQVLCQIVTEPRPGETIGVRSWMALMVCVASWSTAPYHSATRKP